MSFTITYATEPVNPNIAGDRENALRTNLFSKTHTRSIYPAWGFFIDISSGLSTIGNKDISYQNWNSGNSIGYNVNLGYFYSINSLFKIKSGIGISSYHKSYTADGEFTSSELTDIDNDTYTESLTLSGATYNFNPLYLTVPLTFEIGETSVNKLGYYIDLGATFSYLIDENITADGNYTTRGIYPQWGVTLENIPELGFYTKDLIAENDLNKSNLAIHGGAGITIPLSGVMILKLGLNAYLGLTDIGNTPKLPDNSPVSLQVHQFRSAYINNPATITGSKARYIGIELGFIFSKRVK